jgi:hypothetical protein
LAKGNGCQSREEGLTISLSAFTLAPLAFLPCKGTLYGLGALTWTFEWLETVQFVGALHTVKPEW